MKRSLLSLSVRQGVHSIGSKAPPKRTQYTAEHFASYLILAIADAKLYGYIWANVHYGKVTNFTWMEGAKQLLTMAMNNMRTLDVDELACQKALVSLLKLIGITNQTQFWLAVNTILNNEGVKRHYNL